MDRSAPNDAIRVGSLHFVIDDVPVYAEVPTALAKQPPEEAGLVSYAKGRSAFTAIAERGSTVRGRPSAGSHASGMDLGLMVGATGPEPDALPG